MVDDEKAARIRELNDALRQNRSGGRIMITRGIEALGPQMVAMVLEAVFRFDAFTPDNDPYGEHDCASLVVDDVRVLWKIDYYDSSLTMHSPDASDPDVTVRVLTVMQSEEY